MFSFQGGWETIWTDGKRTQVLGRWRCLCMYKWTAVNKKKNMLWFLSMENAGNLCGGSFFFLSALFAKFPYTPTAWTLPCCSPTHTGQQEIGIQCFLDDFLKEMNPSQKMRTMNNGTARLDVPDPSCSRKKKQKNSAHSREACMKKKVVITGLERAMARTIRVRGKQMGFCCAHTIIWFRQGAGRSASVGINLALCRCKMDFIFLPLFITGRIPPGNGELFNQRCVTTISCCAEWKMDVKCKSATAIG